MFELIENCFTEKNVPFNNVSSFGLDGCNTMMGQYNSVATRFLARNHNIVIVKCPSHSLHDKCGEYAIRELPNDIVGLCLIIHAHFSRSSQRQHVLVEYQGFLNIEIQKILRPASTRWLSLEACIARLIAQREALILYFIDAVLIENINNANRILNFLQSKNQKCYLYIK